jgi:putative membrane protein
MQHYYWNVWYFSFGWILWFGFIFLLFSSIFHWHYTYRAHKKFDKRPQKGAIDILDERYARGEITQEQYGRQKQDILGASNENDKLKQ